MTRKTFFQERSVAKICDLNPRPVYTARNLVRNILDLDPYGDALELRFPITPGEFRANAQDSCEASRKCYKHGALVALSQPETQEAAYKTPEIPLAVRERDFEKLRKMHEEDIDFVGYSFRPVQGRDRRKRVVPFVWLPEAARLFAYAENMAGGIEVKPYIDSYRVKTEGANVVCKVPSRTKKKPRYPIKLMHVPVAGVTERRVVAWSLKSDFEFQPEHRTYNMRYTWENDREGSDVFTFYPQDSAAHIATVGSFWNQKIWTPLEMSPLALVSRKEAEYYLKLCNNIVIYDPTITANDGLRKLHIDEKSILIARSIGTLGHDETMYWDPARDGRMKDYNWKVG